MIFFLILYIYINLSENDITKGNPKRVSIIIPLYTKYINIKNNSLLLLFSSLVSDPRSIVLPMMIYVNKYRKLELKEKRLNYFIVDIPSWVFHSIYRYILPMYLFFWIVEVESICVVFEDQKKYFSCTWFVDYKFH